MSGRSALASARTIVVKLGTRALLASAHEIDRDRLAQRVDELVRAQRDGRFVVLVSSGAIGLGWPRLGYTDRPTTIPQLQAAAAVGQSHLMQQYIALLAPLGVHAAQVLLTHGDFQDRRRYLNLRNALHALREAGALPIINENDTVSVDEIRFGDNDLLAALVANAVDADLTVLFTDVHGLYDGDTKLGEVAGVTPAVEGLIRGGKTQGYGSGGMRSKLEAAKQVTRRGGALVVAHGKEDSLDAILAGDTAGTLFMPAAGKLDHRKRWIAWSVREAGTLDVDAGAAEALERRGRSLLPPGITACSGDFLAGDAVLVRAPDGRTIAKGLVNYAAADVRRIMGRRSSEVESILGRREYEEVIHRDNLVTTDGTTA
jgi:glutamate 5-kinase